MLFEPLEDRRLMAVDWRNPVNSLDVSGDGFISPLDALQPINELNDNGSHGLTDLRPGDKPYWDASGDQFISPLDALQVINALNSNQIVPYVLGDGQQIAAEQSVTITVGQTTGTRTYRLQVTPNFDTTDATSSSDDLLAIYLVDPQQPTTTLLDRGTLGTTLFTLSESGTEFAPGRVRWDGEIVEIDLSELTGRDTAELRLQLLNTDSDRGSRVAVRPLTNEVDVNGLVGPKLLDTTMPAAAGAAINLTGLAATDDVNVQIENVRFSSETQRYTAELRLQNTGDSLGRSVAVAFPDLPSGVTLRNPSGTTADGDPYINFAPAISRGGLSQNGRSEPLLVEFDDPTRVPFALTPQILAGTNQPPTLAAIGPLTVMPGGIVRTQLTAADPNGDAITFALGAIPVVGGSPDPLTLPTGILHGDGLLEFTPEPDQLGTYTFDVIASDGVLTARQTVTLDVVADPNMTTRVSGFILDVDQSPLAGMQVEIGAVQGLTQSDGSFTLDLGSGPVVGDTLKVRGELFPGPLVYPFIAEKLAFILEHDVFPSVNNIIARPIFLPPLDVAGGTEIDPMQDTTVQQEVAPGEMAEVFVEAGTLMNQQGSPFTGTLSITEVPADLTPAALPDNLIPDLVVTIQPGEMVFASPAPLTLPNRAGLPAGTPMNLWSINPVTGEFDNVGTGRVSPDGISINTSAGGIRNSSWHFFVPRLRDPRNESELLNCDVCPAQARATSQVELHSGALHETHELVTYHALGSQRGVVLHYDSLRAHPQPIVQFSHEVDGTVVAIADAPAGESRLVAKFSAKLPGAEVELPGAPAGTLGLSGGEHFFKLGNVSAGDVRKRLNAALPIELSGLISGAHPYQLDVGMLRIVDGRASGETTTLESRLVVVDTSDSPFGSGWGIEGLRELIENEDGSVLMIDGDGSEMLFEPPGTAGGAYESPPGHFGTLAKSATGFTHTMPDQTVSIYDAGGRLQSITDRNGNRHSFDYDLAGHFTRIVDPVGLATVLAYENDRVSTITDPANRVTHLEYDDAGNLQRVIDPDQSARSWSYDMDHRMIGETTKRGFAEQVRYDEFGRVTGVTRADGSTMAFQAAQSQALFPLARTSDPSNPPEARFGPPHEVTILDGNQNVERLELNAAGQVTAEHDRFGRRFTAEYDSDFQTTATTDGRGVRTTYEYDSRGNLLSTSDIVALDPTADGGRAYPLREVQFGAQQKILAADINEDSILDVVGLDGRISVNYGIDGNTFQPLQQIPGVAGISDLTFVDVNDDSHLDLLTVSSSAKDAAIRFGDGMGTFGAAQTFILPAAPTNLAVGDLNRDGRPDMAITTGNNNSVSVLLNQGGGVFGGAMAFAVGTFPIRVAIADFDGDEVSDLFVLNETSRDVHVLVNNGAAQFTSAGVFPGGTVVNGTTTAVGEFVVADFNGDGWTDVVTSNPGDGGRGPAAILLNDTLGGLLPAVACLTNSSLVSPSLYAGDLDQDADLDLLIHSGIVLNNGDGTFGNLISKVFGGLRTLVDIDGDSLLDVVSFTVDHGLGGGEFEGAQQLAGTGAGPREVLAGDLNSDGITDLVVLEFNTFSTMLGLGNGAFGNRVTIDGQGSDFSDGGTLVDMDNDGHLDLLFGGNLFYGRGDGTLIPPATHFIDTRTVVADINHDGLVDQIVAVRNSQLVAVSLNHGDRTFESATTFTTGEVSGNYMLAGDVNDDEYTDFVVIGVVDQKVATLLGNADGTLSAPVIQDLGASALTAALGDLNSDGHDDLVVLGLPGFPTIAHILWGAGDGTFSAPEEVLRGGVSFGHRNGVTISDVDSDGHNDVVVAFTNDISLAYGDGAGAFESVSHFRFSAVQNEYVASIADVNGDGRNDIVYPAFETASGPAVYALLEGSSRPRAVSQSTTYDAAFNQPTQVIDELGHTAVLDIDPANGNARSVTRIVGEVGDGDDLMSQFRYTPAGLIDTETDPLGVVTDYDYDPLGRLITITFAVGLPAQGVRQFEYDDAGNLTRFVDEIGGETLIEYDAMGRATVRRDSAPGESQFDYDLQGNLIAAHDPLSRVTQYEYDARDRRTKVIDPGNNATQFQFDAEGNQTEVRDPLGHVSRFTYDARDRRTSATNPNGDVTQYRYDADDNLATLIDPVGNRTTFEYDSRNRQISETDPLGRTLRFAYDAADHLVEKLDRNGRKTRFEYDDLDRLVDETWLNVDGTSANEIQNDYDAAGNLVMTRDVVSQLTFTYDSRHRRISADNMGTSLVPQVQMDYTYDARGNVTSVADTIGGTPAGVTAYAYDQASRLESVAQSGTGVAEKAVALEYNALGQSTALRRFSDLALTQPVVATTFTFDAQNRLAELSHARSGESPLSFFQFTYDAASRIDQITTIDGTTAYGYDAANQLVSAVHDASQPDETYTYDQNGNRLASHEHGSGYVTGPGNRLLSDGAYNYEYDNEGNATRRTEIATGNFREFQWDHRNRLVAVIDKLAIGTATQEVEYTYDTLDRRIAKSVDATPEDAIDGVLTSFVYDRDDVLLTFTDLDGLGGAAPRELSHRYLHGPEVDQVLAEEDANGDVLWHLADHLGTVHDLVNHDGQVVHHATFDAFGQMIEATGTSSPSTYQFTGREFDSETGLYYYRARYYATDTGRFLSEDPLRLQATSTNLFTYVENVPNQFTDPTGLFPFVDVLVGAAVGAIQGGIGAYVARDPHSTHPYFDVLAGVVAGGLLGGLFYSAEGALVVGLLGAAENVLGQLISTRANNFMESRRQCFEELKRYRSYDIDVASVADAFVGTSLGAALGGRLFGGQLGESIAALGGLTTELLNFTESTINGINQAVQSIPVIRRINDALDSAVPNPNGYPQ